MSIYLIILFAAPQWFSVSELKKSTHLSVKLAEKSSSSLRRRSGFLSWLTKSCLSGTLNMSSGRLIHLLSDIELFEEFFFFFFQKFRYPCKVMSIITSHHITDVVIQQYHNMITMGFTGIPKTKLTLLLKQNMHVKSD